MGTSRETSLSSYAKWDFRKELEEKSLAQQGSKTVCRKGQSRSVAPERRAQKGPSCSLAPGSALGCQRARAAVGTAAESSRNGGSHCGRGLPCAQMSPTLNRISSPCPCCPSLHPVPSLSPAVHIQSLATVATFPSSPLILQQPCLSLCCPFSHGFSFPAALTQPRALRGRCWWAGGICRTGGTRLDHAMGLPCQF